MTPRTKAGAAHDAQVALVSAIQKRTWAAAAGPLVPGGAPVNEAIRAFRRAIEDEMLDKVAEAVEGLDAYHPHEAPYVGGDASLPCHRTQCAGGMRLAVLAAIQSIREEASDGR